MGPRRLGRRGIRSLRVPSRRTDRQRHDRARIGTGGIGASAAQSLLALPDAGPSQNIFGDNPATQQLAQANSGAAATQPLIPITALNPTTNPYAAADDLKIRAYNIPFPFAVDTLDQGGFGLRDALASQGIGCTVLSSTTFNDTVNRHGLPLGNQFSKHSRDNQGFAGPPRRRVRGAVRGNGRQRPAHGAPPLAAGGASARVEGGAGAAAGVARPAGRSCS